MSPGQVPLLVVLSALLAGCAIQRGPAVSTGTAVSGATGEVTWLEQGWSQESLDRFTFGGLGAAFVPRDWFMVLERPGRGLFRSARSMEAFGFPVDGPTDSNPDGLPLGLAHSVDPASRTAFVGLNCAACHLGRIEHEEQSIRIAGGQGLTDVIAMLGALHDEIEAVSADEARLESMAAALTALREEPVTAAALKAELVAWLSERGPAMELNAPPIPQGPGRVDAMGVILNLILAVESHIPGSARPVAAPISYPAMWDANRLTANFSAASSGTRSELAAAVNVAQILGSFPILEVEKPGYKSAGYPSSVDIAALGDLQARARILQPPAWPAALPPLDADSVDRGRAQYEQHCISCHPLVDPAAPDARFEVVRVPVQEIGTDPLASEHIAGRSGSTGRYAGRRTKFLEGPRLAPEEEALRVLEHVVAGVMVRAGSVALTAISRSTTRGLGEPPPVLPIAYMARPLRGIWATPPYLHNGSVPSLHALLLPPEDRPVEFHVGDGRYDPAQVGYAQTPGPGQFRFDTSLPGNSKEGHVYGTDLDETSRSDLVEFLKSL
jgi:hypothetical protein